MSTSDPSSSSNTPPSTASTPLGEPKDTGATSSEADKKRQHRAEKKAEQQRRKEERKRIALETGIDPALLPEAIGSGVLSNGKVQPKGFRPREWAQVPLKEGEMELSGSRKVSIMSWNVSLLFDLEELPVMRRD